mmetsp:Transcript_1488/g.4466  ORF Transcript_1488/g.4466 Transcript_1488/m.4466 type:complete len:232 (-) Transcript_1488:128-823(-)
MARLLAMITRFFAHDIDVLYIAGNGAMSAGPPPRKHHKLLVVPGSFNPLHSGHLRLADAARELCKRTYRAEAEVVFEMSMANADKGEISRETAAARLEQFAAAEEAVLLTRSPLYVDKASVVGPCDFVVGADTASRILDPKYYTDGVEATLDEIRRHGCGFVVAGRLDPHTGRYVNADASLAAAPSRHRDLFVTLTESDFRLDISSTELRTSNLCHDADFLATLAERRTSR